MPAPGRFAVAVSTADDEARRRDGRVHRESGSNETPAGGPFHTEQAANAGGYFLGDYGTRDDRERLRSILRHGRESGDEPERRLLLARIADALIPAVEAVARTRPPRLRYVDV